MLLVQHLSGTAWYLPGGGVDKGESFVAAVLRELREEIALEVTAVDRLHGLYHSRREAKDDHIAIFLVLVDSGQAARVRIADPRELGNLAWFEVDALPDEISPATRRRIAEYRAGQTGLGAW